MALLRCPECGHAVSEHAGKCPNCGCPINSGPAPSPGENRFSDNIEQNYQQPVYRQSYDSPEQKKGAGGKIIAIILILILLIGGVIFTIWYLNNDSDNADDIDEPKTEQQDEYQQPDQSTDNSQDVQQDQQTDDQQVQDQDNEEQYYEPGENGGTEDQGAQGGQDVTDDNP